MVKVSFKRKLSYTLKDKTKAKQHVRVNRENTYGLLAGNAGVTRLNAFFDTVLNETNLYYQHLSPACVSSFDLQYFELCEINNK